MTKKSNLMVDNISGRLPKIFWKKLSLTEKSADVKKLELIKTTIFQYKIWRFDEIKQKNI